VFPYQVPRKTMNQHKPVSTSNSHSRKLSQTRVGWFIAYLIRRLKRHHFTKFKLVLTNGQSFTLGHQDSDIGVPTIYLNHSLAVFRSSLNGMMGWAEGYMHANWTCDDLVTLTDWAMYNEPELKRVFKGSKLTQWGNRIYHRWHHNSKSGSRYNITYHYDLGNDFYRLWLDSGMTYSAALFQHPEQDLAAAQQEKYRTIFSLSEAQPGSHLCEIGCGWGGFAELVAQQENLMLHGITLSVAQLEWARKRTQKYGNAISLSLTDYRDLNRTYDHIISIEMFEAVGESHWQTFFQTLQRCLKRSGTAVLQIICIAEERFASYRRNTDFIQRYIFPGGMLPTASKIRQLTDQHGLRLETEQNMGQSYAKTLSIWRRNFLAAAPAIDELGLDHRFQRMWEYYLAYCESGFRYQSIDVRIFKLRKP
jgi:cyclopropane-fatty-acyl-phospholipid synthase